MPAKKCADVVPPNGLSCAKLSPRKSACTIGSTRPTSKRSFTPYVTYAEVTRTSRSIESRNAMTSFSNAGTPYLVQSPAKIASQPAKSTSSCVKVSSMSFMLTPRSVANPNEVRLMPTSARPRPRVCERSAKMGPAEVEVRTGTPPTNWNDSLPLVEPIGMLLMLEASASPIVAISALFSALDAGMK